MAELDDGAVMAEYRRIRRMVADVISEEHPQVPYQVRINGDMIYANFAPFIAEELEFGETEFNEGDRQLRTRIVMFLRDNLGLPR